MKEVGGWKRSSVVGLRLGLGSDEVVVVVVVVGEGVQEVMKGVRREGASQQERVRVRGDSESRDVPRGRMPRI